MGAIAELFKIGYEGNDSFYQKWERINRSWREVLKLTNDAPTAVVVNEQRTPAELLYHLTLDDHERYVFVDADNNPHAYLEQSGDNGVIYDMYMQPVATKRANGIRVYDINNTVIGQVNITGQPHLRSVFVSDYPYQPRIEAFTAVFPNEQHPYGDLFAAAVVSLVRSNKI